MDTILRQLQCQRVRVSFSQHLDHIQHIARHLACDQGYEANAIRSEPNIPPASRVDQDLPGFFALTKRAPGPKILLPSSLVKVRPRNSHSKGAGDSFVLIETVE
jgi:hypothetical protein